MRGLADIFLFHVCEFEAHNFFEKDERTEEGKADMRELDNGNYDVPNTVAYVTKIFRNSENEDWIERSKKQHSSDYRKFCEDSPTDRDCRMYHPRCEGTHFGYMNAMFCQPGALDYFKDYKYIVMNCGHHPAATAEYSYRKYNTLVEDFFSEMRKRQVVGDRKLFWVENVAIPIHQDHNVIDYKDWRTYHRLLLFDYIAKQQAKKFISSIGQVRIAPAFQSTLAVFDKLCDCGHYPPSARMPQLLGLLDQVKISLNMADDHFRAPVHVNGRDCIGFGCGPG